MSNENHTVRYTWLNINTGTFGISWTQDEHPTIDPEDLAKHLQEGFKLIRYECLNDDNFEFTKHMKLR